MVEASKDYLYLLMKFTRLLSQLSIYFYLCEITDLFYRKSYKYSVLSTGSIVIKHLPSMVFRDLVIIYVPIINIFNLVLGHKNARMLKHGAGKGETVEY